MTHSTNSTHPADRGSHHTPTRSVNSYPPPGDGRVVAHSSGSPRGDHGESDPHDGRSSESPGSRGAAVTPTRRAIELEECDGCRKVVTIDLLWRVVDYGLMCPACCDHLRLEGDA